MKKFKFFIISFIAIIMVMTIFSCSSEPKKVTETSKSELTTTLTEREPILEDNESSIEERAALEVDKGLLSVKVTLPASFFEDEDMEQVIDSAKADGIGEVKLNNDGSVTYRMSKSKHNELMKEMATDIVEYIDEIKDSGDYSSINDITYNKKFSEFTLVVDQERFENSFDGFIALGIGIMGMYYQLFDGVEPDNYKVTILMKNAETGEIFGSVTYPDVFDQMDQE